MHGNYLSPFFCSVSGAVAFATQFLHMTGQQSVRIGGIALCQHLHHRKTALGYIEQFLRTAAHDGRFTAARRFA